MIPKDKAIIHNRLNPKKQMDNRPRHKVRMARQLKSIINLSKQALVHQLHNITDTPTTPDFTLHNKTIADINDKTGLNISQITR